MRELRGALAERAKAAALAKEQTEEASLVGGKGCCHTESGERRLHMHAAQEVAGDSAAKPCKDADGGCDDWESHPLLAGFDEEAVARAAEAEAAPTIEPPASVPRALAKTLLAGSGEAADAPAAEAPAVPSDLPGAACGCDSLVSEEFCPSAESTGSRAKTQPSEQEAAHAPHDARAVLGLAQPTPEPEQLWAHTEWIDTASVASSRTTVRNTARAVVCIICWQAGHDANTGCLKGLCFRCKRPGHVAAKCPQAQPAQASRKLVRSCYECGQPGHLARDCRVRWL